MERQLRMYTIEAGELDRFVEEWSTRVVPLRRTFGFEVLGAWRIPDASMFVWLVGYDGPEGYAERDAAYYGSDERRALDPDPARLVETSSTWMVEPVLP